MKHILLITCMAIAPSYAMEELVDSPLHLAAKANNYAACKELLMKMPQETIQLPSPELIASVRQALNTQTVENFAEDNSTKLLSKQLCDQSEAANQERIKRALVLRTAVNAQGQIARECCDNTNTALCKLLDPSQNDMFELDRTPLFDKGEKIEFMGKTYTALQVKKIYEPNSK